MNVESRPSYALLTVGALGFILLALASISTILIVNMVSAQTGASEGGDKSMLLGLAYLAAPILAGLGLIRAGKLTTNGLAKLGGWLLIIFPIALIIFAATADRSTSPMQMLVSATAIMAALMLGWLLAGIWAIKTPALQGPIGKVAGIGSLLAGVGGLALLFGLWSLGGSFNEAKFAGQMEQGRAEAILAWANLLTISAYLFTAGSIIGGLGQAIAMLKTLRRN